MFTLASLFSSALSFFLVTHNYVGPTASLGDTTVVGISHNQGATQAFLGIPFAKAPRFSPPAPHEPYPKQIDATEYGPACIQQNVTATATQAMLNVMALLNITVPVPKSQHEECLSVNIIRPSTATPNSQLPVAVFIYGGGFLFGDSETWDAMGRLMVEKSIENREDTIFVSFNYRLSAYGFIAGSQVKAEHAGNIGLRDQRAVLHWLQKHIGSFGGDPSKVILWGQSAGGTSASFQMLAYDGDNSDLFRGVFSQSGAPLPLGDIENGQHHFDDLAEKAGCGEENDKLLCLRTVPLESLRAAVDATDSFLSNKTLVLSWPPRADGEFLTDTPYQLIQDRKIAQVPLVIGNVDDEGTLFSLPTLGQIVNGPGFTSWVRAIWAPDLTDPETRSLSVHYPNNVFSGSPFDTGLNNTLNNTQYKRVSAFQGDMVFQAPRRFFAHELSQAGRDNVWVYLSKQYKATPVMGSSHGSDVNVNNGIYLMNEHVSKFANYLNPNLGGNSIIWPTYDHTDPQLYLFPKEDDGGNKPPPQIANDDHRALPFAFLTELAKKYPL
ncbi:alpha/beta-hydrolase [Macrolepiota fuliginosa MF-IS2]|uniref:Carboxylic ester hydrolase n=1 Tax=Macrolepiota fuliginosa MF-IS2 TaxID=1400762 RepID=A0A9P5X1G9_9AGAR|nr:alpha/beta-hydrolase [Macrolepiota fuliginosa MF-IS2]